MNILLVDLGSNAMRASTYLGTPKGLKRIHDFRFPIRLGDDVFKTGIIGKKLLAELTHSFQELLLLCATHNIPYVMAIATSALREAKNGKRVIDHIFKMTGIKINLISGTSEAKLAYQAIKKNIKTPKSSKNYTLLIDMGGGSCEIVLCNKEKIFAAQSFALGSVRLLELSGLTQMQKIVAAHEKKMRAFLAPYLKGNAKILMAIGTGGNFKVLKKLRKKVLNKKESSICLKSDINKIYDELIQKDYFERIEHFDLRPDRADVIIPATLVIKSVMKWFNINKILLSEFGVKEGMLENLQKNLTI
jgi:exopolyphosphatase/guanosine-5'-triphosphate,3'-diphosphate pyrophosphatase